MDAKFDYVMVDKDNLVGCKETDWIEKAYEKGDIFVKGQQLFVYTNGDYRKASAGDLIIFEDGKFKLIESNTIYEKFGKQKVSSEPPACYHKKEETVDTADAYSAVFLGKNGKYMSVQDTTWFEEELKKQDIIKYNEGFDTYTVNGCSLNKLAAPGDMIIKCYGKIMVFDSWSVIVHMLMFHKNEIFGESKNEEVE